MIRMGWIALLATACGLLLAPSAGGEVGAELSPGEMFWLGPYYAGLRLEGTPAQTGETTFVYGDCELPEGEGGCSPPLDVQNWASCARNPVALDSLPYEVFRLRGGAIAAAYGSTDIDVGTGRETVAMFTNEVELMGAALRDIRHRSEPAPQELPPPVYPMPVLRELKRVTVAAKRFGSIKAISKAIHLSPGKVAVRLRVAQLLGPHALDGVPVPTMSTATVERLRQLSFNARYDPARAARENGMTVAEVEKKIRLVRGLAGAC